MHDTPCDSVWVDGTKIALAGDLCGFMRVRRNVPTSTNNPDDLKKIHGHKRSSYPNTPGRREKPGHMKQKSSYQTPRRMGQRIASSTAPPPAASSALPALPFTPPAASSATSASPIAPPAPASPIALPTSSPASPIAPPAPASPISPPASPSEESIPWILTNKDFISEYPSSKYSIPQSVKNQRAAKYLFHNRETLTEPLDIYVGFKDINTDKLKVYLTNKLESGIIVGYINAEDVLSDAICCLIKIRLEPGTKVLNVNKRVLLISDGTLDDKDTKYLFNFGQSSESVYLFDIIDAFFTASIISKNNPYDDFDSKCITGVKNISCPLFAQIDIEQGVRNFSRITAKTLSTRPSNTSTYETVLKHKSEDVIFDRIALKYYNFKNVADVSQLNIEWFLMRNVCGQNANIVNVYGIPWSIPSLSTPNHMDSYLALEYTNYSWGTQTDQKLSLDTCEKNYFTPSMIFASLTYGISKALTFLHKQGIKYNGVKLSNTGYTVVAPGMIVFKLNDFELATTLSEASTSTPFKQDQDDFRQMIMNVLLWSNPKTDRNVVYSFVLNPIKNADAPYIPLMKLPSKFAWLSEWSGIQSRPYEMLINDARSFEVPFPLKIPILSDWTDIKFPINGTQIDQGVYEEMHTTKKANSVDVYYINQGTGIYPVPVYTTFSHYSNIYFPACYEIKGELGLMWKKIGENKPMGKEITNEKLTRALNGTVHFRLTRQELERFGINDVQADNFIQSGESYFIPDEGGSIFFSTETSTP